MDYRTFQQAATLLSGEYSLAILRAMRNGDWHLSSEIAKGLNIHVSTASRFLQRLADLGLVERRSHSSRSFQYRLHNAQLRLELDLLDDSGPLREAVDFYVAYFQFLFEAIRALGQVTVEGEMEHRLENEHLDLRASVFEQMITGSNGGLDHLRTLMAAVHRDLWQACSESLGPAKAEKVFQSALRGAIDIHPDLAARCGLVLPLES